jgi:hypothetical protein
MRYQTPYFLIYPFEFISLAGLITTGIGLSLSFRFFVKKTLLKVPLSFTDHDRVENANNLSLIATGIFIIALANKMIHNSSYL